MWGRVVEIMTAVWLAFSPYIFPGGDMVFYHWFDNLIALSIIVFAGLSFWRPTRHAHVLTLLVALGLAIFGRLQGSPPAPIDQNHIAVGLFLLMIAIIPNYASQPPREVQCSTSNNFPSPST